MSELDTIKQMPHSLQAEQALLGALILDQSNMTAVEKLTAESFYVDIHKVIYSAILSLFRQSRSIDLITLVDTVKKESGDPDFDFPKYIKTLCDIAVENSNISEYVRIINEKATLRGLIGASKQISEKAFSETGDVNKLVNFAEKTILDVADDRYRSGLVHISEVTKEIYRGYEETIKNPNKDFGIQTGFSELDRLFVGLGEGDLVIVGARPGVGKTSFALNIALNIGKSNPDTEIAIFSLEMSRAQLVNRLICCQALINNYTVRKCSFTDEELSEAALACSTLAKTGIYIDDTPDITVTDMMAKVRRLKNLGLIIIDYLQLMHGETHKDNRVLEVGDITRSLKLLAKEMRIPIILCSQLSRPMKNQKEKRPNVTDLRDSGAIEQDADIIMLLYNEDREKRDEKAPIPDKETIKCIVGKNRHGEQGDIDFAWVGQYFKFLALDSSHSGDNNVEQPKQA